MKNKPHSKLTKAGLLALFVVGFALATAQPAAAATLTAFVQDQQCQGGDVVQVTLSATVQPSVKVQYTWDLNGDGIFDTPLSRDPTVVTTYPDEVNVTATVKAVARNGRSISDPITFQTIRCGG